MIVALKKGLETFLKRPGNPPYKNVYFDGTNDFHGTFGDLGGFYEFYGVMILWDRSHDSGTCPANCAELGLNGLAVAHNFSKGLHFFFITRVVWILLFDC